MAANLNFSSGGNAVIPPLVLTISGPGATNSTSVTVSTTGTLGTISATAVTGTGGNWLCASANGTTLTISVGSLCGGTVTTTQLQTNTSYNGQINVSDSNMNSGVLPITLQVGATSGGTGLVASQNPVTFSVPSGSSNQSTTVGITFFGAPQTITSLTTSTNTGSAWLQATNLGTSIQITVFPTSLTSSSASDTGTVTVITPNGNLNIQVNLTVGNGTSSGLAANPNPLTLTATAGSTSIVSQSVNITNNGAAIGLNGVSTTGQNWLNVFISGTGLVTVQANPSGLSGNYTGTVFVNTTAGQVSFQVNFNVGTGNTFGLAASPNPLNINVGFGAGSQTQTVNITYNNASTPVNSVSVTQGQSWLTVNNFGTGFVSVTVNPSGLSGNYFGTVTASTNFGPVSFSVNLSVGAGNSTGLVATPSTLNFNIPIQGAGAVPSTQNVNITFNGSPATIQSATPILSGQNWLLLSNTNTGVETVGINGVSLTNGTYNATVQVMTTSGMVSFQVNLTVGQSTGSNGLVATPNPLNLNLPVGGGASSQNVNVTFNGSPVTINSVPVSTSSGGNWLSASISSTTGAVTVTASPVSLAAGSYSGTVTINTNSGTATLVVNLTVGSGGTVGLAATPSVVTLSASAGGTTNPQNVSITNNGSPVTINSVSSTTTTGQNWLLPSFSPTIPGTVTVNTSLSTLASGSYTGTVTVNTLSGTVTFQVNLTVGTGTTGNGLIVSPNPITFTQSAPASAPPQIVTVTLNGVMQAITQATFAPSLPGFTFINTVINSDGTVTLTVNNVASQQGTYTGTLTLFTSAGGSVAAPVTLMFGTGGTSGLVATPNPVNFNVQTGGTATAQNVAITFNGSSIAITNVTATTNTGGSWLQATPSSLTGNVTVTANASGLSSGTYTGTVAVTTASGNVSFQVNLTVGGTATLSVNPAAVNFAYQVGTTAPPSQTIMVSSSGSPVTITVTSSISSGSVQWLTVTPSGQSTTPTTLTISVQPTGLAAGVTYSGNIQIQTFGATSNPTINIPVTLLVSNSPVIYVSPNTLSFNVQSGSTPPSQNLALSSSGAALNFTVAANVTTPAGVNWLQAQAQGGTTPSNITISVVNTQSLPAGTYSGTVTISSPGAGNTTLSIPVSLTVTGGGGGSLQLSVTSLSFAYATGQAQPPSQSVTITATGGAQIAFTAAASTTASPTWLSITPTSGTTGSGVAPASITANVNATGLAPGTYTGTITVTAAGSTTPQLITVTLVVTGAPPTPTPTVVAIQNAASYIPTALSPGLNILIYGSNMGPATLTKFTVGANGTVATTLAGTQVTFDGVPAPIIFTSATLVSVMVPYEIAGRASTALVVTFNGGSSTALQLRVVDTAPGLYTVTQTGTGQGAILNQDGSVNSSTNTEVVGNIIQIYVTGEGQTSPAGVDGAISPNRLPLPTPVALVEVIIGGIPVAAANITYAGEAPSNVSGVMQVNAKIPPGVASGPASVVVRVGGVPSQANVTVAVR
jgi:uncharacterized protein (TIGR03437 family)